jgi:hypothetical protein
MAKSVLAKLQRLVYGEPDKLLGHVDATGCGYAVTHPTSHGSDHMAVRTEGA